MSPQTSTALRQCYFWLYGFLGIWGTLLGSYLEGLDFTGLQIASIIACTPIASIFIPPLWGMLADRMGNATLPLQLALFGSAIFLIPLPWIKTFGVMLVLYALFALFRAGTGALLDSISLSTIETEGGDYGRIRLFGSVGFLVFGMGVAFSADTFGDHMIIWGMVVVQGAAALSSLLLPKTRRVPSKHYLENVRTLFARRGFALFIFTSFLSQLAMGPAMIFYPIHLKATGSTNAVVSAFWCVGVAAEVLFLNYAGSLQKKVGWGTLYLLSIAGLLIRFGPLLYVDHVVPVLALQCLHALTFGAFFYVCIHFARASAPETLQASAQTLFAAIVFGLANGMGILISGSIYDHFGIQGVLVMSVSIAGLTLGFAVPTARYIDELLSNQK